MNPTTLESASPQIAAEAILEQMERLLASRHFRQTRTLDKFLRHTVTKALAGQAGELKESLIGREVFHRGEDFNPSLDSVVRVQAGMLRKKLASYYAEEGLADEIIIDLPKGCYVPAFQARQSAPPDLAAALALIKADEPALNVPSLSAPAEIASAARIKRPAVVWQSAVAFVVGMALMLGLVQWRAARARRAANQAQALSAQPPSPLWEKFFEPGSTTVLAFGTPQFFQFNGLYLRDVLVNSPQEIEQEAGERLASVRKIFKQTLYPIEVYTGVGEAHGIHTLSQFFWQHAQPLQIARSRLVGWQEIKNSNLIFLSSMRFHTLAEQLNYPNDFTIRAEGVSGTIINSHPAAGEQAEYAAHGGDHYAVITLWPGKAEQRRILQLSGNTTWGTLAAAEYVTSEDALRQLSLHLEECRKLHGWSQHPPYFQVLVRSEVKDNQPITSTYVTHHDLDLKAPSGEVATAFP